MARRKRVREEAERVLGMLDMVVGWGGAIHAASGRGDWGLEDERDVLWIIIYLFIVLEGGTRRGWRRRREGKWFLDEGFISANKLGWAFC